MSDEKLKIKNCLKKGDDRYTLVVPKGVKSEIWKHFRLVEFEGKAEPYACCLKCSELLMYTSRKGTGSLLRHSCMQHLASTSGTQKTLDSFKISKVPQLVKDNLALCQLQFVTKDLRSLSICEGRSTLFT